MNQQPDKIFRDKLHSYLTPAPPAAWSRIEAKLDKKNNKALWLKVAASLLLLAVAVYVLWPGKSNVTPVPQIAKSIEQKDKAKTPDVVIEKNEPVAEAHEVIPPPSKEFPLRKSQPRIKAKAVNKTVLNKIDEQPVIAATDNLKPVEENILHEEEIESVTLSSAATEESVTVTTIKDEKVKIIFAAEDVDNKYLDKNAVAQATSDNKKQSTLKKIFDKAYDLKYNQDPFGDLRDKKNEILALNFRTDKQRSDKK